MTGPFQEKETVPPSLVEAASAGDLSAVRTLLDGGADIDGTNQGGQTPLILAAVMGHTEVVAHLIEGGANPQLRDHLGLTAYEWSTRRGFSEISQILAKVSPPIPQPKPAKKVTTAEITAPAKPIAVSEHQTPAAPIQEIVEVPAAVAAAEDSAPPKESVAEVSAPQIPVAPSHDIHAADTDSILDLPESLTSGSQPLPQYFDSAPPTPAKPIPSLKVSSIPSGDNKPPVTAPIIPNEEDETVPRVRATQHPRETSWLSTILPAASADPPERSAAFESAPAHQRARKSSSMLGLSKAAAHDESSPSHFARPDLASVAPASPTAIVVWVLIAFVLGASAFAAYRLTRYLYRPEPPAPIAAAPVEAPAEVKKPAFSVGGDLAGTELNIPEPELSFEAARSGAAGPIIVKVRVNQKGRVISAATSSGDRRLRAAAVKAAREATFAPDKLAGLSSRSRIVSGTITYEFAPAPTSIDTSTSASNANETPTTTTAAPNTDPNAPVVSDTLANAVKNIPAADYPAAARRANASGTIIVTVRVNRTGKVVSWRSSSGNSQLRAAAIKAARKATFSPDKLPGTGDTLGTITYNFTP